MKARGEYKSITEYDDADFDAVVRQVDPDRRRESMKHITEASDDEISDVVADADWHDEVAAALRAAFDFSPPHRPLSDSTALIEERAELAEVTDLLLKSHKKRTFTISRQFLADVLSALSTPKGN